MAEDPHCESPIRNPGEARILQKMMKQMEAVPRSRGDRRETYLGLTGCSLC